MVEPLEWRRGDLAISTDPRRLDLSTIHGFLARSYWAEGIPREVLDRSIAGSICFGLYRDGRQIGFARVVTDRATFAWVGDVFVVEEERGRGLAAWLLQVVANHPELQGLRRWALVTRDAHGLYRGTGFTPLAAPERWMKRWDPEVYSRPAPDAARA